MAKTRSISFILVILTLWALASIVEGGGKKCPRNEFYTDCGGSCQTKCATLNQPCLIRHIRCPDGCYCNNGYARDAYNVCIPIEKCTAAAY